MLPENWKPVLAPDRKAWMRVETRLAAQGQTTHHKADICVLQ